MIFSKFGPYNLETKFLLFKTRKIDFFAAYIGEKLREKTESNNRKVITCTTV